jgi:FtsP/CotA-like multicopper oxidase with cupredoxin domain
VAGFILTEGSVTEGTGPLSSPGPTIALRRDEPVEITVVNRLVEATALHWHGIELDSYYDGVHGFSGVGPRVTPMIEPGRSFAVRFTPPRAGTFIYHTHLHDYRQLSSGLYGAIVVSDEGDVFNPEIDHVVVLGRTGVSSDAQSILITPESVVMNGERSPRFVWKGGVTHRVRLINITTDDIFAVSLRAGGSLASWTPLAKDGAPLPAAATTARPAEQVIAVGETYDFEFEAPPQRGTAWLEVRTTGGKWLVQGQVIVK